MKQKNQTSEGPTTLANGPARKEGPSLRWAKALGPGVGSKKTESHAGERPRDPYAPARSTNTFLLLFVSVFEFDGVRVRVLSLRGQRRAWPVIELGRWWISADGV
jgi:hypothetical protein